MPRFSFATFSSLSVVMVAAALLLSGCQGGSTPGTSPSATGSTTASPTLSETPTAVPSSAASAAVYKPADAKGKAQNVPVPVMPELAKENSKAGLEAFIGYWYATYSYALETGDLTPWLKTTDASVPAAQAHKESVEQNYIDGRWIAGGRLSAPVVEIQWSGDVATQSAKVQVIQEAIQYFDANGTKGQQDSSQTNTADAVFSRYADGAWQVTNYGSIVG